jgi:protoheme IX farnesyltransferase
LNLVSSIPSSNILQRASYFFELTKPRILLMILVSVIMAFVAVRSDVGARVLFHACVGTAFVASSASVLNQWLEKNRDAIMIRTSRRPIPSGRIASSQAAWMGWLLLIVGTVYLAAFVNMPAMLWGLVTWFLYVWVYTPLKMVTWLNTLVGTIPGALPVWIGWTAADGSIGDPYAWVLLGILIAWQLPHFMAIAWMYREQYESAGYKMITVIDKSGRGAAWHALIGAFSLIVLAYLAIPPSGILTGVLCGMAVLLACWQFLIAVRFSRRPEMSSARRMLFASLIHLPLTLSLIAVSFWVG